VKFSSLLELLASKGDKPSSFAFSTEITADAEIAGTNLRRVLKVSLDEQRSWKDGRKAFNGWRSYAEVAGVMVLQTSDLTLDEMRAYSLYARTLPVVVVNRKDVPVARVFSLLHELVHLGLHTEGVCDLTTAVERPPEDQKLEVFCNAVAAAVLLPKSALLVHSIVTSHPASLAWDDQDIVQLARTFSTSREALLRRLLTLGLTSEAFYRQKREEYSIEYEARAPRKGFVTPPADIISLYGKPYVRLVLEGLEAGAVTTSDAADYLGLRLKHLPALSASLESDSA
jgi:Zn-dependent peptidase ImmA (M78 family)